MSATVYGRRAIRRIERETGEKIVHMSGPFATTADHRHLGWTGEEWVELAQTSDDCGIVSLVGYGLSSCSWLFGDSRFGFARGLMRGPCSQCGVGCGELHRWDCGRLNTLMTHVNPDYWPRPVHRPMWQDDPRRRVL